MLCDLFILSHLNTLKQSGIRGYLCQLGEKLLWQVLDFCCYHLTTYESLKESQVDLIDFAYQKMIELSHSDFSCPEQTVDLTAKVCAISISRYFTDHISGLSLGALQYIINEKDFVSVFVQLIESRFWL